MSPRRLSTAFLCAFILSVLLLQWHQQPHYPSAVFAVLGCLVILSLIGSVRFQEIALLPASLLGITLALFTVARTTHVPSPETIDTFADGRTVTVEGVIDDAPDIRERQILYVLNAKHLQDDGGSYPVSGKTLVSDRRLWPRFSYGESVVIEGTLKRPEASDTFAYDQYLSLQQIYSQMEAKTIHATGALLRSRPQLMTHLILLRERLEAQINRVFPEPQAALLAGLLTGTRRGLPEEMQTAFQRTGLTHIIAISGYNITIILSIIGSLLFFLPLRWRLLPSILAIVCFTLFVGASPSVVRAAIMGMLGLLALHTGRLKDMRLVILWAAFFMLMWNPKQLWYDAGFQLSFLAVIGLTECGALLEQWLRGVPETCGIRESLAMTIAAQLFAVPVVVWHFGSLSLIAPLANILVAPLVPLAMLFGFLGTTLSWIFFPLGQMIGGIAHLLLTLIISLALSLGSIPGAAVPIASLSVFVLILYYCVLMTGLWWLRRKGNTETGPHPGPLLPPIQQ